MMEINILTILITLINLILFIAIPIGIVIFIVRIIKKQNEMKLDIEALKNRVNELERK